MVTKQWLELEGCLVTPFASVFPSYRVVLKDTQHIPQSVNHRQTVTMYVKPASSSWSSCLALPSASVTEFCHYPLADRLHVIYAESISGNLEKVLKATSDNLFA